MEPKTAPEPEVAPQKLVPEPEVLRMKPEPETPKAEPAKKTPEALKTRGKCVVNCKNIVIFFNVLL